MEGFRGYAGIGEGDPADGIAGLYGVSVLILRHSRPSTSDHAFRVDWPE